MMLWLTHKAAPAVLAGSIFFLAAFLGPIVEALLHAPVWVWGVIIAAAAVVCIVWWLRLEYRMTSEVRENPFQEVS